MKDLIYFELKKSLNVVIVLAAAVLCAAWFFFCRLCYVACYDNINGDVYRDYVSHLCDLEFDERKEYIELEKNTMHNILSAESEMQEKYFNGELFDSEYLEYIDRYNYFDARSKTFDVILNKFNRFQENPSLRYIYDLELEGYLTTMTADFPLVIMLMIFAANMFIPELQINPFILTSKNGKRKSLLSKLLAYLMIMTALIFMYNFAEIAALFSKNLCDMSAPAASMDRFAELPTEISCFSLVFQTFSFRIISEVSISIVFFAIASKCRKHITFLCISIFFSFFPALLSEILPNCIYGMTLYYSLIGNSILLDNNRVFAIIGIVIWTAAAFIVIKKHKFFIN